MKLLKKTLALLLTLVMVFGLVPSAVFAEDDPAEPTYTVELVCEDEDLEVNGGDQFIIQVKVTGGDFDGFYVEIEYDPTVFTHSGGSLSLPKPLEGTDNKLFIRSDASYGQQYTDGQVISEIMFDAQYSDQDHTGTFKITHAEVHNPAASVYDPNEAAAAGPGVDVTVKATTRPSITFVYGESAQEAGISSIYLRMNFGQGNEIHSYSTNYSIDNSMQNNVLAWVRTGFEANYEFKGWELTNMETGEFQFITGDTPLSDDEPYTSITLYPNVTKSDEQAYADSGIRVRYPSFLVGYWTLEPIFEEKAASYEFSFGELDAETVNAGEEVSLDIMVDGAAYDAAEATVTYDAELFEYTSCTEGLAADTSTAGTVVICGSGLNSADGDTFATLVFTAKSTQEGGTGTFTITEAKAGASPEALVDATAGDPVNVTVNAALEDITVTPYGYAFVLGEDYSIEGNVVTVTFDIPC